MSKSNVTNSTSHSCSSNHSVTSNKRTRGYKHDDEVPIRFLCDLTNKLMVDPVTTIYGHTMERTALQKWFQRGFNTCPITNEPLKMKTCYVLTNTALQKEIQTYIFQQNLYASFPSIAKSALSLHEGQRQEQQQKDEEDEDEEDMHLSRHPYFADLLGLPTEEDRGYLPNGIPKFIYVDMEQTEEDALSKVNAAASYGRNVLSRSTRKLGKVMKRIFVSPTKTTATTPTTTPQVTSC